MLILTFSACSDNSDDIEEHRASASVPNIIVDTDLGNSTDDLFALQALFAFHAEGKCRIKGIMHNRPHLKSKSLMDCLMHFYKADNIPLGMLEGNENFFEITPYYELVDSILPNGKPLFEPTGIPLTDRMPAWKLYRKLLSEADDHSITIVSIGMFTNLGLLIDSQADEYSPLTGVELIRKKVVSFEVMAGCFTPVPLRYPTAESESCSFLDVEYNILGNIALAKKVIEQWPGQIRIFPLEEGMKFPSVHNQILAQYAWQKDNPIYQVHSRYDEWSKGDVGQFLWDVFPVLHSVLGEDVFSCTKSGIISIDDSGATTFELSKEGNAHIVSLNATGVGNMWKVFEHISHFHP